MTEIIYSFDDKYSTKKVIRTTSTQIPQTSTTKPPKVNINLIAVQTGVLVGIPVSVFFLGILSTIFGVYFWYKFVPIGSHHNTKINEAELKLPDNIYEMTAPPNYQNNTKNNINIHTINLDKFDMYSKF